MLLVDFVDKDLNSLNARTFCSATCILRPTDLELFRFYFSKRNMITDLLSVPFAINVISIVGIVLKSSMQKKILCNRVTINS